MSRYSLSRTALLLECSAFLDPAMPWSDTKSDEAEGGTAVGAVAEAIVKGAHYELPEDPRVRRYCEHTRAWLDERDMRASASVRAEVPFAWDFVRDRGRELPSNGHRDYSAATADERCGTADLFELREDEDGRFVWIADWKCHFGFGGERLDAKAQLFALALAACRAHGLHRAKLVALHVDDRGVDDSSEVYDLDAFDLLLFAKSLRERLTAPPSPPTPGDHCSQRYCGAIAGCPRTQGAMVQLVPDVALVRQDWRYQPVIESPDHLAWLVSMRPTLRAAMKQVDAAIDRAVADGPVQTTDGRVVEQTFRNMPRQNAAALEALAKELGATDEQLALCTRMNREGNGVRISGGAKRGRAA